MVWHRFEGGDEASGPDGEKSVSPFKTSYGDPRKGPIVQGIAYCLYACSARHTGTDWSRTYVSYPQGRVRRLTPLESERIQGFPDNWTLPLKFDEDSERIESKRYHAAGNAVTVNVAEWLGRRVASALAARSALVGAPPKKVAAKKAAKKRSDVDAHVLV